MGSHITMWGRNRHQESLDALKFLKANGYGVDRLLDLARQPPDAQDLEALRKHLGSLEKLVDLRHPRLVELVGDPAAAGDDLLKQTLLTHPELIRAPVLDTPKGALAGFREQQWRRFLGLGGEMRD